MSTLPLRVELSSEEARTLQDLRVASRIHQRTKDRAEALRLSHRGWTPHHIAAYLGGQVATACTAFIGGSRRGVWAVG